MALIKLLAARRAKLGELELDASVQEVHRTTAKVTRHPVEDGASIADHIVEEPDELQVEGIVSNHPTNLGGAELAGGESGDFGRADTAYGELLFMAKAREPITVVTTLNTYDDMIIESLEVPRNVKLGQVVRFTAHLTQIRTVASQTVEVAAEPKVERGKAKQSRGKQPAKPVENESFARRLRRMKRIFGR